MKSWFEVILLVVLILIFCSGVTLALYPSIYGAVVDREISSNAADFLQQSAEPPPSDPLIQIVPDEPEEPIPEIKYPELLEQMQAYNTRIYEQGQSGLSCEYDYQAPSFRLKDYGLDSEIFGVITIPAMDLEMPIFLGATKQHMADGVAHMSQTSLPIGGMNTNCVIAGHRGYSGASYFRYIEKLKVGDIVSITNLWETLQYRVSSIKIIDPHEVEDILIQEGRDMITLLTCHPYASGGRQRYLVYCDRIQTIN